MSTPKRNKKKPMTSEMVQMANAKIAELISKQNFNSIEEANEFLKKHINGINVDEMFFTPDENKTDSEKSDDLIYEAYESSPSQGLKLAKKALKLNPNNIRAINYIAGRTKDLNESISLFKQAIAIGEKQLGKKYFRENKGYFWGLHETRPYMTAKLSLANCLRLSNKNDEAIKLLKELLILNPNDNQGARYFLSGLLIYEEKYDEYLKLYKSFKEETTFWLFNYALFLYITLGETKVTNNVLKKANKCNKYVLQYLAFSKQLDPVMPEYYSPGDEREAVLYLMDNYLIWAKHKDSFYWISKFLKENT